MSEANIKTEDLDLARAATGGDEKAWRRIYDDTNQQLYNFLCYQTGDTDAARDLLEFRGAILVLQRQKDLLDRAYGHDQQERGVAFRGGHDVDATDAAGLWLDGRGDGGAAVVVGVEVEDQTASPVGGEVETTSAPLAIPGGAGPIQPGQG